MLKIKIAILLCAVTLVWSCSGSTEKELPYLGPSHTDENGEVVHHQIPDFKFIDQYGDTISQADFDGKIYVADFFFTSCPTICPVMKSQMIRIYDKFKGQEEVRILSHSIDPYHDSVSVLHDYAEALGVKGKQWFFVTGDQDQIYDIGQHAYMVTADVDTVAAEETGGYIHSGAFILVDKNKHVRGLYDGTKEEEVNKLMKDIELLLKENEE
ncbi:SCO family protein [Marinilongibacter aquaticus]|uniref:SCO family protein n=1 Tax=Marinilongibacter aquaticus TaxID=2975157 RepID=UPI0021BD95B6|nr:SCO family protein [Marinilongibacter aquaticus]UBM58870.1 SCO family protein [Marinilongibacter aquaticus]